MKYQKDFTNRTKAFIVIISIILAGLIAWTGDSWADVLERESAHERYLYPIVRVAGGGSGTIVYSQKAHAKLDPDDVVFGAYSTYVLTNYHVISDAIRISDEWDSDLQKSVKKERRSIVYVEIFKYQDLSTPVGTLRLESDLVLYNKTEDMALLKLRFDEPVKYAAKMPIKDNVADYKVMDKAIAVGCSLGYPPIPSVGRISRLNVQLDSLPYHMSSAQIIFGNSGGAMFLEDGTFIGIPSRVPVVGWSSAVSHMGLFIPVERIYEWMEEEHYDFIYDAELNEKESLEIREKEIEEKLEAQK